MAALVAVAFTLPAAPAHAATGGAETEAVVAQVNEERESAGCSSVTVDGRLTTAAQRHSQDQADRGVMTHTGADGSTTGERATRAGYRWSRIGENVASGTTSAERVMTMWMNSSGHRANIVNCEYRHIGVARVGGYWTQVFGRPK